MFTISNNKIVHVNRGDSFNLPVELNIGTAFQPCYYGMTSEDHVYIGIMEPGQRFEDAILKKVASVKEEVSAGHLLVKFDSKDTVCLLPGKYYYQVKLQIRNAENSYDVITLLDKTLFYVLE